MCVDCFQSRADTGANEMYAGITRNTPECENQLLSLYGNTLLSVKQEDDDRKELIYVALARNHCRAMIEA